MSLRRFVEVYGVKLIEAVQEYPAEYGYSVAQVPNIVEKMSAAFAQRSYNKDGRAIKATCKALGIKYTYTAINAFLAEQENA